jgi:DNA-binding PadR family transcriptional regulator
VEILKAIDQPMSFSDIQKQTRADKNSLVYALDFLEKQDLIKTIKNQNEAVYENTPRGLLVTKFFLERSQITPQETLLAE